METSIDAKICYDRRAPTKPLKTQLLHCCHRYHHIVAAVAFVAVVVVVVAKTITCSRDDS